MKEMTLDEAIQHCEEVAEENEKFCYKKGGEGGYFNEDTDWDNTKCASEYQQLAEWLKDYKRLLERESCEDAISRETVKTEYKHRLESSLKDESREIDLTYFADCTRFNEFIDSIPPVNSLLCEDAISRQAAIEALDKIFDSIPMEQAIEILKLRRALRELPSAQQEPKTGHWIFVDKAKEHAHCSECDYGNVDLVDGRPHNYCTNCGAKMVEPQESEG